MSDPPPVRDDDLEAAYALHAPALKRLAFLMTGSDAAAEDAIHEVFVRCADRLHTIDHPLSYLRAAVVNECRADHRRRERTHVVRVVPSDPDELPHEVLETLDALQGLSDRKRAAIVLRYFVDIPDDEIAEVLGCAPSTVRSLVRRAVIELREVLR